LDSRLFAVCSNPNFIWGVLLHAHVCRIKSSSRGRMRLIFGLLLGSLMLHLSLIDEGLTCGSLRLWPGMPRVRLRPNVLQCKNLCMLEVNLLYLLWSSSCRGLQNSLMKAQPTTSMIKLRCH
jgi:hypothetical protein